MGEQSRLSIVMDKLGVTGRELSEKLNIDNTTISKFKNGTRKLKYKSDNLIKISTFFVNQQIETKNNFLSEIILNEMPYINTNKKDEFVDAVCGWLTHEKELSFVENECYNTKLQVFYGATGLDESLKTFWKMLQWLPNGQNITIVDYADIEFESDTCDRILRMIEYMKSCVNKNHVIRIIDGAANKYEPYRTIFRWLDIYMSDNVEVYFGQHKDKRESKYTIFLVDDQCVLYTMGLESMPDMHHSMIFSDRRSIEFFGKVSSAELAKSHLIISKVPMVDIIGITDLLFNKLQAGKVTYTINSVPTFRSMSESLLKKVLEENNVDSFVAEKCIKANIKNRTVRQRCHYRQIYNLDLMWENCNNGYSVDADLSAICGKTITVNRHLLKLHIEELLNFQYSEIYSVVLLSNEELKKIAEDISIIVQYDSLGIVWNGKKYSNRMYCRSSNLVNELYNLLETTWISASEESRKEKWIKEQFTKMLQCLA